MAAEKAGKKKEEELIDRLEEAKDELDFYKQNAERSGVDPKKVKELEGKVIDLERKCKGLVKEVDEGKVEKDRLEGEVGKVRDLEEELERLRVHSSASATEAEDIHSSAALLAEIDSLKVKVAEQEQAIAAAPTSGPAAPESDRIVDLTKQNRQLKRDIDMAKHLVSTAEKERDEFELENEELNRKLRASAGDAPILGNEEIERLQAALREAEGLVKQYKQDADRLEKAVDAEKEVKSSVSAELEVSVRFSAFDHPVLPG